MYVPNVKKDSNLPRLGVLARLALGEELLMQAVLRGDGPITMADCTYYYIGPSDIIFAYTLEEDE